MKDTLFLTQPGMQFIHFEPDDRWVTSPRTEPGVPGFESEKESYDKRQKLLSYLLFSALLSGMQEPACFLKPSKMVIYYKSPNYFVMRGHCYIFYYICSLCGF